MSRFLADRVQRDYEVPIRVIPNGLGELLAAAIGGCDAAAIRLDARGDISLTVARIDPQKCQLDLIEAFRQAQPTDWKLALAGGADYACDYVRAVAEAAKQRRASCCSAIRREAALAELYANAGAFVLPSSHEGQPIAVIEALGYGCPVILSDIPAHRELGIAAGQYLPPRRYRRHWRSACARCSAIRPTARFTPPIAIASSTPRLARDRAFHARCLPRRAAAAARGRDAVGAAGLG